MMTDKPIYAVIYANGRAETMKDGATYWSVLSEVYTAYQSAGGNWNQPAMLLKDGKVVVEKGLADLAWQYGKDAYEAQTAAVTANRAKHKPDWLEAE